MESKLKILPNGAKFWWLNGKQHREDGPAIEFSNGAKIWLLDGKIHREDGPAIEFADGDIEWWLNGDKLTKQQLISENMKINYPEIYNSYLVYHIIGS